MKKLGCVVLIVLSFFVGMKWSERACTKEKRAQLSAVSKEFKKEIDAKGKAETMAKVIAAENERLRAENAALEARLKDCKPVPETKRVVPRKKKPRALKPKSCEKKVVSTPKEKVLAPPEAITPAPLVPQKKEPCPGGEMKVVAGKWQCVKDEAKVQAEPTPSVVPAPADDFFANAVDEEVEAQASVQTPVQVAPVYVAYEPLSRLNCMTEPYTEGNGRFYPAGFQHDNRTNGKCRCGSPGCDLRWPWQR